MRPLAFSSPGKFWRGNLHSHSTRSDGRLSPEEICTYYRSMGYDFLALTDHFMERYGFPVTDTTPYRTDDFTTIFGAELHTGTTELGHLWHILSVGLPLDFAPYGEGETGGEVAARAMAAGAFVAVAHPAWYGITEGDVRSLGDVHAIEIFNGTSADHNDKPDSVYLLDLMLMRGVRMNACATDDTHFNPNRHDSLRGWVHVKSETNEPESLLSALKAGAYYSSTGPQILDMEIEGDHLHVRCSPARRVWVTGHGYTSSSAEGSGMTQANLSLKPLGASRFFRVTVADAQGGRAWSNPIWWE